MTLQNAVNLLLKVLKLLLCSLCHVLHILLLVQGNFQRAAVCIHALQYLPIMNTSLEKGWVQRKANPLFHPLMLVKGVYTALLELRETAHMGKIVGAGGVQARACSDGSSIVRQFYGACRLVSLMQQQVMIDLVTAFFLIFIDLVKLDRDFAVDGLERGESISIVLLMDRLYRLYAWKPLSVTSDLAHMFVLYRFTRLVKVHT